MVSALPREIHCYFRTHDTDQLIYPDFLSRTGNGEGLGEEGQAHIPSHSAGVDGEHERSGYSTAT